MSRDQRLLMLMHGGATNWERLTAWCELACSPAARESYRRYSKVSKALRATLADPDELVAINVPRQRIAPNKTGTLLLLGALTLIVFFEWRNYTIPALADVIRSIAHRCGL